jgi:Na+/H+ antiporter NhaC
VLVWAGFLAFFVNLVLIRWHRIMGPADTLMTYINGMKLFLPPIVILLHAWAIGAVVKELMLPQYIVASLGDSIPKEFLPVLVFILASIISFSTGTSFGTMAALFPMVIPLAWKVGGESTDEVNKSIASILAGSIWGDHCSPISDTTILSALSSMCSVSAHVRTQLPYCLVVGFGSAIFGSLLHGHGLNEFICLPISWVAILIFVRVFGRRVPEWRQESAVEKRKSESACEARTQG